MQRRKKGARKHMAGHQKYAKEEKNEKRGLGSSIDGSAGLGRGYGMSASCSRKTST